MPEQPMATSAGRGLESRVDVMEVSLRETRDQVDGLRTEMGSGFARLESLVVNNNSDRDSGKKFTMQLIAGVVVPMIVSLVAVLWFVITLQINTTTGPMKENVTYLQGQAQAAANNQQVLLQDVGLLKRENSGSIEDRLHLNQQISVLTAQVASNVAHISQMNAERIAKETEIETQFNADAQLRNVQFSEQQRMNAILWDTLSDAGMKMPKYPGGPFYQPNISRSMGKSN